MTDIDILRQTRATLVRQIDALSEEQMVAIPASFRNNILWNVGHLIVTQQILQYKLSGLEMYVPDHVVAGFRKGSSPADWATTPDIGQIKTWLVELPDRLEADYENGRFERYQEYTTSAGYLLASIDDAIKFNNHHEGMHTGVITALRKLV